MKNPIPLTEKIYSCMEHGDYTVKEISKILNNKYNTNSVRTAMGNLYRSGKITRCARIGQEEVKFHRITESQEETMMVMMNRLLAPVRGWEVRHGN